MNNVNMAGMGNPMGGPVGGGMPMMNNGMAGGQPRTTQDTQRFRALLNTYIYDYFITNEMGDCARALINSKQPLNLNESKGSRDENGNVLNNGVADDNGDEMKVDPDSKRLGDLPAPQLPDKANSDSNFLYDWWCLFWEMYAAQRGETGQRGSIKPYLNFTQQARQKSEQQANALRQMRPDLINNPAAYQQMLQMRNQQNGMMPNEMARKAMANSRNATPQQLQMLKQQQQQQMQRDGSDMDGSRRPQSPNGSENAPSPSKRPKLEGAPFNGQQGMMSNGRGQTQGMGPVQQFQALQAAQANKGGVQAYAQSLAQHQQKQMPVNGMPNGALPQGQGSPMMTQGGDGIYDQYNANGMAPNGMPRGGAGQAGAGGNHALQDYQMQLMLLEQQNKKRLMMARQEQDTFTGGREGSVPVAGVQGPNGQPMQGNSPQAPRPGVSPNPNDMKRGTPQMGNAGIPSPSDQARNSPANMNFISGQMDPNINPAFYNQMKGMEGSMVPGGMQNGMRPPNAQPGFANQMSAQHIAMVRHQQQQQAQQQALQAGSQISGWQGPNGAPMMNQQSQQGQQQQGQQQGQQGQQGVPTPQQMGTPLQRAMPPPSAPVAAVNGNARTQPSSPQQPPAPPTPSQANKANPKAKKDNKERKKPAKKGSTAATGATPSAEAIAEPATPTPATPITPVHPASFNKNQNGAAQPTTNGQAPVPAPAPVITGPPQQDTTQQPSFLDDGTMFGMPMGFDNASMGNTDVLQDFDFDSFLHQDGDNGDAFAFDPSGFNMEGGEIGAE